MSVIIKSFTATLSPKPFFLPSLIQFRNYAARKGTREKARKKKVKKEEVKVGFIPHNQRGLDKEQIHRPTRKFNDSWKQIATDNVYPMKYYRWKVYPFSEAVQCHRETHHPTMYNEPDAFLKAVIELDTTAEKKNKFMDSFKSVAWIPHKFEHGEERNVLAFAKDPEMQQEARDAGAMLAGGVELVKEIHSGAISLQEFQYFVAHPNILPEIVSLRGLMKRRFPAPKNGTLGPDLAKMVFRFLHGISYTATKDEYEKDFGLIEAPIGILSMDTEHLEANLKALLQNVHEMRPKKSNAFIRRCLLISEPCTERLKIDHNIYMNEDIAENDEEDDIDEDEQVKAAV